MTGTENQISWAILIKVQVAAEFDRVAKALAIYNRPGIIALLEEKRAKVLSDERAGYFIAHWGEMNGQVSRMIRDDARYSALMK